MSGEGIDSRQVPAREVNVLAAYRSFVPPVGNPHDLAFAAVRHGYDAGRAAYAEEHQSLKDGVSQMTSHMLDLMADRDGLAQQIAAVRAWREYFAAPVGHESYHHDVRRLDAILASVPPVTPESGEPLLAIDGKPVCTCPGDDPDWRESAGHEDYCPRAVTPESETNR